MNSFLSNILRNRNYQKLKRLIIVFICLIPLIITACSFSSIDAVKDTKVENLKVHYIDVGQGDSIFIQLPNEETMLIDGGTRKAGSIVIEYLNYLGIEKIDYVIATHPHEDHIGGLVEIINKYDIGKVYMPNVIHTTKVFEDLLLAIQNKGKKITKAVAGNNILNYEDLRMKIIAPEAELNDSNFNNYSIVVKLDYKKNSFLFTGDAESKSENIILDKEYDIKSDVLKLGHHGSDTSTTSEFLNEVNPKYGVISVGSDNQYDHPHEVIIDNLKTKGIEIYRTDRDGTIIATSDGKKISFNTEHRTTDNMYDVYITDTGNKYHLNDCRTLKNSKITISLKEAKNQGYTPCKVCNPPN